MLHEYKGSLFLCCMNTRVLYFSNVSLIMHDQALFYMIFVVKMSESKSVYSFINFFWPFLDSQLCMKLFLIRSKVKTLKLTILTRPPSTSVERVTPRRVY